MENKIKSTGSTQKIQIIFFIFNYISIKIFTYRLTKVNLRQFLKNSKKVKNIKYVTARCF